MFFFGARGAATVVVAQVLQMRVLANKNCLESKRANDMSTVFVVGVVVCSSSCQKLPPRRAAAAAAAAASRRGAAVWSLFIY